VQKVFKKTGRGRQGQRIQTKKRGNGLIGRRQNQERVMSAGH